MSLYLIVLILSIGGPLGLSFEKNLMLYKRWKYLMPAIVVTGLVFLIWDIIFTNIGCWEFNPRYNSGIYLFHLPLEEYLFFLAIPYACIFSYYAIKFHFPNYFVSQKATRLATIIIVILSLTVSLLNYDKTYTFVNFLVLPLVLLSAYKLAFGVLQYFYSIFPVLLIPFFIVNGILTGTGIDQEVFSYDPDVILGVFILTMPLEDMFYAFSLLLMAISLTELFENQLKKIPAK